MKLTDVSYFGRGCCLDSETKRIANVSNEAKFYTKIVYLGCLFATSDKINERSCNYFAQLVDNRFVKLNKFIIDFNNGQELAICRVIKTNESNLNVFFKEVLEYSELVCIQTNLITKICTFITINSKSYIIAAPNMLSY